MYNGMAEWHAEWHAGGMSEWCAHRGSDMLDVAPGDMHDGMVDA
jgi:hypothetical protein